MKILTSLASVSFILLPSLAHAAVFIQPSTARDECRRYIWHLPNFSDLPEDRLKSGTISSHGGKMVIYWSVLQDKPVEFRKIGTCTFIGAEIEAVEVRPESPNPRIPLPRTYLEVLVKVMKNNSIRCQLFQDAYYYNSDNNRTYYVECDDKRYTLEGEGNGQWTVTKNDRE